jgi:alpha-L-fucosidase
MLQHGDPAGTVWRPGEADVSIRPGWFYHPAEDERVRSVDDLVSLYFLSVGRNSKLLLNVPPTPAGLLHETDVARLRGMREQLGGLLDDDVAGAVRRGRARTVSIADLREPVERAGQRVSRYTLHGRTAAGWRVLTEGTTIGHRKLDRFAPVAISGVRIEAEGIGSAEVELRLYE